MTAAIGSVKPLALIPGGPDTLEIHWSLRSLEASCTALCHRQAGTYKVKAWICELAKLTGSLQRACSSHYNAPEALWDVGMDICVKILNCLYTKQENAKKLLKQRLRRYSAISEFLLLLRVTHKETRIEFGKSSWFNEAVSEPESYEKTLRLLHMILSDLLQVVLYPLLKISTGMTKQSVGIDPQDALPAARLLLQCFDNISTLWIDRLTCGFSMPGGGRRQLVSQCLEHFYPSLLPGLGASQLLHFAGFRLEVEVDEACALKDCEALYQRLLQVFLTSFEVLFSNSPAAVAHVFQVQNVKIEKGIVTGVPDVWKTRVFPLKRSVYFKATQKEGRHIQAAESITGVAFFERLQKELLAIAAQSNSPSEDALCVEHLARVAGCCHLAGVGFSVLLSRDTTHAMANDVESWCSYQQRHLNATALFLDLADCIVQISDALSEHLFDYTVFCVCSGLRLLLEAVDNFKLYRPRDTLGSLTNACIECILARCLGVWRRSTTNTDTPVINGETEASERSEKPKAITATFSKKRDGALWSLIQSVLVVNTACIESWWDTFFASLSDGSGSHYRDEDNDRAHSLTYLLEALARASDLEAFIDAFKMFCSTQDLKQLDFRCFTHPHSLTTFESLSRLLSLAQVPVIVGGWLDVVETLAFRCRASCGAGFNSLFPIVMVVGAYLRGISLRETQLSAAAATLWRLHGVTKTLWSIFCQSYGSVSAEGDLSTSDSICFFKEESPFSSWVLFEGLAYFFSGELNLCRSVAGWLKPLMFSCNVKNVCSQNSLYTGGKTGSVNFFEDTAFFQTILKWEKETSEWATLLVKRWLDDGRDLADGCVSQVQEREMKHKTTSLLLEVLIPALINGFAVQTEGEAMMNTLLSECLWKCLRSNSENLKRGSWQESAYLCLFIKYVSSLDATVSVGTAVERGSPRPSKRRRTEKILQTCPIFFPPSLGASTYDEWIFNLTLRYLTRGIELDSVAFEGLQSKKQLYLPYFGTSQDATFWMRMSSCLDSRLRKCVTNFLRRLPASAQGRAMVKLGSSILDRLGYSFDCVNEEGGQGLLSNVETAFSSLLFLKLLEYCPEAPRLVTADLAVWLKRLSVLLRRIAEEVASEVPSSLGNLPPKSFCIALGVLGLVVAQFLRLLYAIPGELLLYAKYIRRSVKAYRRVGVLLQTRFWGFYEKSFLENSETGLEMPHTDVGSDVTFLWTWIIPHFWARILGTQTASGSTSDRCTILDNVKDLFQPFSVNISVSDDGEVFHLSTARNLLQTSNRHDEFEVVWEKTVGIAALSSWCRWGLRAPQKKSTPPSVVQLNIPWDTLLVCPRLETTVSTGGGGNAKSERRRCPLDLLNSIAMHALSDLILTLLKRSRSYRGAVLEQQGIDISNTTSCFSTAVERLVVDYAKAFAGSLPHSMPSTTVTSVSSLEAFQAVSIMAQLTSASLSVTDGSQEGRKDKALCNIMRLVQQIYYVSFEELAQQNMQGCALQGLQQLRLVTEVHESLLSQAHFLWNWATRGAPVTVADGTGWSTMNATIGTGFEASAMQFLKPPNPTDVERLTWGVIESDIMPSLLLSAIGFFFAKNLLALQFSFLLYENENEPSAGDFCSSHSEPSSLSFTFASSSALKQIALLDVVAQCTRCRTLIFRIVRPLFAAVAESSQTLLSLKGKSHSRLLRMFKSIISTFVNNLEAVLIETRLVNTVSTRDIVAEKNRISLWIAAFCRLVHIAYNLHEMMKLALALADAKGICGSWDKTCLEDLLRLASIGSLALRFLLSDTTPETDAVAYTTARAESYCLQSVHLELLIVHVCMALHGAISIRRDTAGEMSSCALSLRRSLLNRSGSFEVILRSLFGALYVLPLPELSLLLARHLTKIWTTLYAGVVQHSIPLHRGAADVVREVMNTEGVTPAVVARSVSFKRNLACLGKSDCYVPFKDSSKGSFQEEEEEGQWRRVENTVLTCGIHPILEKMDDKIKTHLFATLDVEARGRFQKVHSDFERYHNPRSQTHRDL